MSDGLTEGGEKYVLDYFTAKEQAPGEELPFRYRTHYLPDALAEAWRIRKEGGQALQISQGQQTVFDREALESALNHMDEAERAAAWGHARVLADQVIRGLRQQQT